MTVRPARRVNLKLPRVLRFTLLAGSVTACTSTSPSPSQPLTCQETIDGSVETFTPDAATCPDGAAQVITT